MFILTIMPNPAWPHDARVTLRLYRDTFTSGWTWTSAGVNCTNCRCVTFLSAATWLSRVSPQILSVTSELEGMLCSGSALFIVQVVSLQMFFSGGDPAAALWQSFVSGRFDIVFLFHLTVLCCSGGVTIQNEYWKTIFPCVHLGIKASLFVILNFFSPQLSNLWLLLCARERWLFPTTHPPRGACGSLQWENLLHVFLWKTEHTHSFFVTLTILNFFQKTQFIYLLPSVRSVKIIFRGPNQHICRPQRTRKRRIFIFNLKILHIYIYIHAKRNACCFL